MQLIVDRSTEESTKRGGFFGTGREQKYHIFVMTLALEGVTEKQKEILDLYTYITRDGNRERFINVRIPVMEQETYSYLVDENLLSGPRHVTIPQLIGGITWRCSVLIESFAEIPNRVASYLEADVLGSIAVGDLWSEIGREVIEIEAPLEEE